MHGQLTPSCCRLTGGSLLPHYAVLWHSIICRSFREGWIRRGEGGVKGSESQLGLWPGRSARGWGVMLVMGILA